MKQTLLHIASKKLNMNKAIVLCLLLLAYTASLQTGVTEPVLIASPAQEMVEGRAEVKAIATETYAEEIEEEANGLVIYWNALKVVSLLFVVAGAIHGERTSQFIRKKRLQEYSHLAFIAL